MGFCTIHRPKKFFYFDIYKQSMGSIKRKYEGNLKRGGVVPDRYSVIILFGPVDLLTLHFPDLLSDIDPLPSVYIMGFICEMVYNKDPDMVLVHSTISM